MKKELFKMINSIKETGFLFTFVRIKRKLKWIRFIYPYRKAYYINHLERKRQEEYIFPKNIKFSILVPLYNTPPKFLHEMIKSVLEQTYSNWELCLVDGSDDKEEKERIICESYQKKDSRIIYKKLIKNLGISENTNECIKIATGEYIILFDHDDILHVSALYEIMKVICKFDADYIYTDEIIFSKKLSHVISIHFKPQYAIDNLRANNYICHLSAFKKSLLDSVGMFRKEYDGSQDYDLILRLTEKAKTIIHIPKILYFWRSHAKSVASNISAKTYAIAAGRNAVEDHLKRCKLKGKVKNSDIFPAIYNIKYEIKEKPYISIILYGSKKNSKNNIEKIKKISSYINYEVILAERNEYNTKTLNSIVSSAKGKYLIFLSDEVEILTSQWIENMLEYAQRKDVGMVGVKIYYKNNKIYHAGIVINSNNEIIYPYQGYYYKEHGYMGKLCYVQNYVLISGLCCMLEKSKFEKIGGFNEQFKIKYGFYDLCIKLFKNKYLTIFQPSVEMYYKGKETLGKEDRIIIKKYLIKEKITDKYYTKNVKI